MMARRLRRRMTMTPPEEKVYNAVKSAGATTAEKAMKVDDIAKKVLPMGKGQVAAAIANLKQKGYLAIGGAARANAYFVKK
jgi:hypothetical protein